MYEGKKQKKDITRQGWREKAREPVSLKAATEHLTAAKSLLIALRYSLVSVRCSLAAVRWSRAFSLRITRRRHIKKKIDRRLKIVL